MQRLTLYCTHVGAGAANTHHPDSLFSVCSKYYPERLHWLNAWFPYSFVYVCQSTRSPFIPADASVISDVFVEFLFSFCFQFWVCLEFTEKIKLLWWILNDCVQEVSDAKCWLCFKNTKQSVQKWGIRSAFFKMCNCYTPLALQRDKAEFMNILLYSVSSGSDNLYMNFIQLNCKKHQLMKQ